MGLKTHQDGWLLVALYSAVSLLLGDRFFFIALVNTIFPSGIVRAQFSLWSYTQQGSSAFDPTLPRVPVEAAARLSEGGACGSCRPALFDWFSSDSQPRRYAHELFSLSLPPERPGIFSAYGTFAWFWTALAEGLRADFSKEDEQIVSKRTSTARVFT